MKMGELCNRTVIVAEPQDTVRDIAALMRDRHVGCVVIVEVRHGQSIPVGIVTDRDISIGVVAGGRDPSGTPVSAIMSSEPYCAREQQDVYDVLQ
jgi:CBS domain-containing protein